MKNYEENLTCIEPHTTELGRNKDCVLSSFQYIPLLDILKALRSSENSYAEVNYKPKSKDGMYLKYIDGVEHKKGETGDISLTESWSQASHLPRE